MTKTIRIAQHKDGTAYLDINGVTILVHYDGTINTGPMATVDDALSSPHYTLIFDNTSREAKSNANDSDPKNLPKPETGERIWIELVDGEFRTGTVERYDSWGDGGEYICLIDATSNCGWRGNTSAWWPSEENTTHTEYQVVAWGLLPVEQPDEPTEFAARVKINGTMYVNVPEHSDDMIPWFDGDDYYNWSDLIKIANRDDIQIAVL